MAGSTVYLRGQVAQDLDTRESVAIGDPAGQASKVMDNIETSARRGRRPAGAHRHLRRLPDRHPPPRAGLRRARRAAAGGVSVLHRPGRAGARPAGVAGGSDRGRGEAVTFSLVGRCARTGMLGTVVASSSPAVAARCAWARASVGAVATQNVTDPSLGPRVLGLLASGRSAASALDEVMATAPHAEYRQLAVIDAQGRTASYSGARTLGRHGSSSGNDCLAAGNLLASGEVTAAMVQAFGHAPPGPPRRAGSSTPCAPARRRAARKGRCARAGCWSWTR